MVHLALNRGSMSKIFADYRLLDVDWGNPGQRQRRCERFWKTTDINRLRQVSDVVGKITLADRRGGAGFEVLF